MKSKEEIFDEVVGKSHRELSPLNYKNVSDFADLYSQQMAVAFAEWIAASGWIKYPPIEEDGKEDVWYYPGNDIMVPNEEKGTSQLYQLFLSQQQTTT